MGKLFKRGDTYYADLRTEGLGKVSLHTSDRAVAKVRLRDAELGTTSQASHAPKALGHAIDEMILLKRPVTAAFYREKAGHLFRLLGEAADINTLTRAQVAEYCTTRLREGAARHTIHKELVVLRQALKEAKLRNEFAGNVDIVPTWKAEYEPKTRWLTPDDFAKLLSVAPPHRHPWLMIQAYTGAELGAMRRLAWEHVNLTRGVITIPGTKRTARYRTDMPLHPQLKAYLKTLDSAQPLIRPWLKVHRDMKLYCSRAGIVPPATTHDLRRTFGSWLVQAGVDLHHVARLMGNTPAMVARVYGQTSDASYAAAIKRLPRLRKVRR